MEIIEAHGYIPRVVDRSQEADAKRRDPTKKARRWVVKAAVQANAVVVVGMAQNPFPARARKALDAIGHPYNYLEYDSYFGMWRPRSALRRRVKIT